VDFDLRQGVRATYAVPRRMGGRPPPHPRTLNPGGNSVPLKRVHFLRDPKIFDAISCLRSRRPIRTFTDTTAFWSLEHRLRATLVALLFVNGPRDYRVESVSHAGWSAAPTLKCSASCAVYPDLALRTLGASGGLRGGNSHKSRHTDYCRCSRRLYCGLRWRKTHQSWYNSKLDRWRDRRRHGWADVCWSHSNDLWPNTQR